MTMKGHRRRSCRSLRTRQLCARQGLTILEVLIAIGVAIIGLFGVWALIPIAGQKTERALLEDNKSALGRRAFRDFDVRGMRQSENWLVPRSTYPQMRSFYQPYAPRANWIPMASPAVQSSEFAPVDSPDVQGHLTLFQDNLAVFQGHSFCIDPQTFAEAIAQGQSVNSDIRWFPALPVQMPPDPNLPQTFMLRTTLRANPFVREPVLPNAMNPATPPIVPFGYAMQEALAKVIFEAADDIIVSQQDDETLPPRQEFSRVNPEDPSSAAILRAARGDLSWMATLVPAGPFQTDYFRMSIVVFNQRDLATPIDQRETSRDVLGFPGGGFGGGEIVLQSADTNLRRNDWVLLGQTWVPWIQDSTSTAPPYPYLGFNFGWYRVVSADPDDTTDPSNPVTNVTLEGRDWNPAIPTDCILVKNVVAVYEKTIRLESSSLWSTR